jgi:hypothetical protein
MNLREFVGMDLRHGLTKQLVDQHGPRPMHNSKRNTPRFPLLPSKGSAPNQIVQAFKLTDRASGAVVAAR